MNDGKPFHVELTLKQRKKFGAKTKKLILDIKRSDVKRHLQEFLSPYQNNLLKEEIRNNSIDFGHLVTEICKHDSKNGNIVNNFDYNAIRIAKMEESVKKDFIEYLKFVLKMEEDMSDFDM